jgi:spore coat polysaccharide biosynthesis protein SpsF
MKKVIIIQARMTSTRLPGKILMKIGGEPMLKQQLKRLRRCKLVDEIVLATTTNRDDDPVEELARQENIGCFRGSEHDVLGRYVGAAEQAAADVVIRSTADCPLIDEEITDLVIMELIDNANDCDYASNTGRRTFPRGLDVEAFFTDTLHRMNRFGKSAAAREHVTVVLHSEKPELFARREVCDAEDNSDLRLTVDTAADLDLIRRLYDELDLNTRILSHREIIAHLRSRHELIQINKGIETWSPTPNHS